MLPIQMTLSDFEGHFNFLKFFIFPYRQEIKNALAMQSGKWHVISTVI